MLKASFGRWRRAAIIGLAAAVLVGCSTVRLAYDQGPTLAYWWVDRYLDFDDTQAPRVKAALARWFAWHRQTQLPDYAALLVKAQQEVVGPLTADQICDWGDVVWTRLEPSIEHALPLAADVVPSLTLEQVAHMEARYTKTNADYRKDFLQPKAADRLKASVERSIERAESFYGRLDERQKRLVATSVAASPFDADTWYDERVARQRDVLSTLRKLIVERADRDRALAALKQMARRMEEGSRLDGDAQQKRLSDYNCEFGARIHESMSPKQRDHARDKLRGWEQDVRRLIAEPRP